MSPDRPTAQHLPQVAVVILVAFIESHVQPGLAQGGAGQISESSWNPDAWMKYPV